MLYKTLDGYLIKVPGRGFYGPRHGIMFRIRARARRALMTRPDLKGGELYAVRLQIVKKLIAEKVCE